MQQLWLSSPALGTCIPNLGRFKASNNLVKWTVWKNTFTGQDITPLYICHPNITVHLFLALLLNLVHFGHFAPVSTLFLQHFLGSKIVARMMKI